MRATKSLILGSFLAAGALSASSINSVTNTARFELINIPDSFTKVFELTNDNPVSIHFDSSAKGVRCIVDGSDIDLETGTKLFKKGESVSCGYSNTDVLSNSTTLSLNYKFDTPEVEWSKVANSKHQEAKDIQKLAASNNPDISKIEKSMKALGSEMPKISRTETFRGRDGIVTVEREIKAGSVIRIKGIESNSDFSVGARKGLFQSKLYTSKNSIMPNQKYKALVCATTNLDNDFRRISTLIEDNKINKIENLFEEEASKLNELSFKFAPTLDKKGHAKTTGSFTVNEDTQLVCFVNENIGSFEDLGNSKAVFKYEIYDLNEIRSKADQLVYDQELLKEAEAQKELRKITERAKKSIRELQEKAAANLALYGDRASGFGQAIESCNDEKMVLDNEILAQGYAHQQEIEDLKLENEKNLMTKLDSATAYTANVTDSLKNEILIKDNAYNDLLVEMNTREHFKKSLALGKLTLKHALVNVKVNTFENEEGVSSQELKLNVDGYYVTDTGRNVTIKNDSHLLSEAQAQIVLPKHISDPEDFKFAVCGQHSLGFVKEVNNISNSIDSKRGYYKNYTAKNFMDKMRRSSFTKMKNINDVATKCRITNKNSSIAGLQLNRADDYRFIMKITDGVVKVTNIQGYYESSSDQTVLVEANNFDNHPLATARRDLRTNRYDGIQAKSNKDLFSTIDNLLYK